MINLRNVRRVEVPRCCGGYLKKVPAEVWSNSNWFIEPEIAGDRVTLQIGKNKSLLVGGSREEKTKEFEDLSYLNPRLARIKSTELANTVLDGGLTEVFTQSGMLNKATKRRCVDKIFTGYTTWGALFWMGEDVRSYSEKDRYHLAERAVEWLGCPKLRLIERLAATEKNLQKIFDRGVEGAVAKQWDKPIPGEKANRYWLKIKGGKRRTVAAFIKGVKPGPDNTAASFTMGMIRNGRVIDVGKMKMMLDTCHENGFVKFGKFKNKVVEMQVSGWDGQAFRWPKWYKLRLDKSPEDCRFEEQL